MHSKQQESCADQKKKQEDSHKPNFGVILRYLFFFFGPTIFSNLGLGLEKTERKYLDLFGLCWPENNIYMGSLCNTSIINMLLNFFLPRSSTRLNDRGTAPQMTDLTAGRIWMDWVQFQYAVKLFRNLEKHCSLVPTKPY